MTSVQPVGDLSPQPLSESQLAEYLSDVRALVLPEIRRIIPVESPQAGTLYGLMLDYPLRSAKALRPAISIATCRALGGRLEAVLPSAAVLELYHNAFLIHDDVQDGSEKRRELPTLHERWGAPIAINVGDAMLALALEPLLANMRLLGMGKALRILQAISLMARESAEGQAIELGWIHEGAYDKTDDAYRHMVEKKTCYYSFVTPMLIGATVAGMDAARMALLIRFAKQLGVAFQIQDDVLNLTSMAETAYGKESCGDLWEGKLTLVLLHALRSSSLAERERAREILRKSRPNRSSLELLAEVEQLAETAGRYGDQPEHEGAASSEQKGPALTRLTTQLDTLRLKLASRCKTNEDVAFLRDLVTRYESLEYARSCALGYAEAAASTLAAMDGVFPASSHRAFLEGLVQYVIRRDR